MTTTTTTFSGARSGPVDPLGTDLVRTLKQLKLGQMSQTLPERLVLARQQKLSHAAFLQLVLDDEITRRDLPLGDPARTRGRARPRHADRHLGRPRRPHLRPRAARRPGHPAVHRSRPRRPDPRPVGVGKTHLACALGHIAIRRRMTVHAARTDKLFTRLRAARLDNTLEAELRKLAASTCSSSTYAEPATMPRMMACWPRVHGFWR